VSTTGTASYDVDLPDGGYAVVSGNVIVQGPASQNPALVHFGGEGPPYAGSRLQVTGNVLENFLASGGTGVLNQTSVGASVTDNKLYRLPTPVSGPNTQSGDVTLTTPVALDTGPPWAN
jgi:hypothetical protein